MSIPINAKARGNYFFLLAINLANAAMAKAMKPPGITIAPIKTAILCALFMPAPIIWPFFIKSQGMVTLNP